MWKFTKSALLIGKNIAKISKRTLISPKDLRLYGFKNSRLRFKIYKNSAEFRSEIQNLSIPALVNSTKLWTLGATKKDDQIDLLRQSLNRIYENSHQIQEPEDVANLYHVGPMAMRMFHHLELPEIALQVS